MIMRMDRSSPGNGDIGMNSAQPRHLGAGPACVVVLTWALLWMPMLVGISHAATLSVAPQAVEPGRPVKLNGAGMRPLETVDIKFDGKPIAQDRAGAAGKFVTPDVIVPQRLPPGAHQFVATGRTSGLRAQASLTIRTNWPQFRRGPFRQGENPHEVLIGPGNVSRLRVVWSKAFGQPVYDRSVPLVFSPVVAEGVVYTYSHPQADSGSTLWALDARTVSLRQTCMN
jgi:hypothetical protein